MDYIRFMTWLIDMAIWDADGRMYLPVVGYDGQVQVYAQARDALIAAENQFANPVVQ